MAIETIITEELIDAATLADLIGVSLRTIQRWTRDRRIPEPIRFGRRTIRYRKSDIESWLEAGTLNDEEN